MRGWNNQCALVDVSDSAADAVITHKTTVYAADAVITDGTIRLITVIANSIAAVTETVADKFKSGIQCI